MIFNYFNLYRPTAIALLLFSMISCKKDDLPSETGLFSSEFKNLQLNSGFIDNGIPINAENWSVDYVKDAISGETLKDKTGKKMVLNAPGSVELLDGWLMLKRKQGENLLTISLKENFSANPRKFLIGISANGKRDELSFLQTRGEAYTIVKKEIREVPGSRIEYTSNDGIRGITLSNGFSKPRNMETSVIFKDVCSVSEFSSDDYGAFGWVDSSDFFISMDEVLRNGVIFWAGKVPYKKGLSLEPYFKPGNKEELLVPPYANVNIRGEILYLERECLYTFTIKNLSSGHTFETSGTWKQKIPLSHTTYIE